MAYTNVYLTDGIKTRTAPVGFSWTVLFFGPFPPIFRGDWKFFFIIAICNLLSYGLAGIIFSFFYNKMYINELLNEGYKFYNTPGITDEKLKEYLGVAYIQRHSLR